jgi:L,D-transpeptidase catalytic domain
VRQLLPILFAIAIVTPAAAQAQDVLVTPETPQPTDAGPVAPMTAPVIFTPGTGDGTPTPSTSSTTALPPPVPIRALFGCMGLDDAKSRLLAQYADATPVKSRLDKGLLAKALDSYRLNICSYGKSGPAIFAVVDFAKRSSEPRLWYIDLQTATGLDTPVLVTHGNGSDPDGDGYADRFSNINDSRMSSLGAFRGGERYQGRNGLSLRLDGLDAGNSLVRFRNIVVHTSRETDRSYFAFETRARQNGAIGVSDGCFVVERFERERLIQTLENGGFLYAGIGTLDPGRTMPEIVTVWPKPATPVSPPLSSPIVTGNVEFVPGTGDPASAP